MRKTVAILLAVLMALLSLGAHAEAIEIVDVVEADAADVSMPPDEFVVGLAGKLSGHFFTGLWSNSTYDADVRAMIHGYETVVFGEQYSFVENQTAVRAIDQQENTDGSKTYTLTLQRGLTYNDGTPISALDYVFGLLFMGSAQARALGGATAMVSHIQGYDAYNAGDTSVFSGLRLVDEHTYSVTVKAECLPFFYELSMVQANPYPIGVIAPGCEVADDGEGAYIRNIDRTESEPIFSVELLQETVFKPETGYMSHPSVSSGPYALTGFDIETGEARFEINTEFKGDWRGQKPTIDNVLVRYYPPAELIPALESDEAHLVNKVVSGSDIKAGLNSEDALKAFPYPRLGLGFLAFSCELGPTKSEAVRQAMGHALNAAEFVSEFNQSYGMPVYGYYGIGQWMVQLIFAGGPPSEDEPVDGEAAADDLWAALSLDNLTAYNQDLDAAKALLESDGWTLNESGAPFTAGEGAVRYRKGADGELEKLTLRFAKQSDNEAAQLLVYKLMEPMAVLGMELEVVEYPFGDLLDCYYRHESRTFNMTFLATNFSSVFDPYFTFSTDDAMQGLMNTSGLKDEKLAESALSLRRTEPGDLLGYCQKWLSFQQTFGEKVPMLPLYSNVYYDFSVPQLQDYNPNKEVNWPSALLYAHWGEAGMETIDEEAEMGMPGDGDADDGAI